jgi:hypothetical protein
MVAESEYRSYRWVLPIVAAAFSGGLAGSVFTWYVNRPRPTVLTYKIVTTTLSAPEAQGLIPDLNVLIGGIPIQALYAHNVELLPRQGPFVDQADVAFTFASSVRIYGIHEESPSDLHHLECSGLPANSKASVQLPNPAKEIHSVQCTIRPVLFQGSDTHPFRITMATDKSDPPNVLVAARNLELAPADQYSSRDTGLPWVAYLTLAYTLGTMTMALPYWLGMKWARWQYGNKLSSPKT